MNVPTKARITKTNYFMSKYRIEVYYPPTNSWVYIGLKGTKRGARRAAKRMLYEEIITLKPNK